MKKRNMLWLGVVFAFLLVPGALAIDWDGGGGTDTDWSNATNWVGDVEPDAATSAAVVGGYVASITETNEACKYFSLGNATGNGTLNMSAGDMTFSASAYIGQHGGAGTINLSGGAMDAQFFGIGFTDGDGVVNLTGSNTTLDVSNGLDIGYWGDAGTASGTLAIDGGKVTTHGGSDTYVAHNADTFGMLSLTNGGRLYTGGLKVAAHARANGTINLEDDGYLSVPYYMYVGQTGTGTVIQTGGILHCGSASSKWASGLAIGGYNGSTGSYTISGGLLDVQTAGTNGASGFRLGGWSDAYDGAGTLTVVGSGATITLENYNQFSSGTLVAEIGTNGISVIDVNGTNDNNGVANLDGTFEVVDSGAAYGAYTILVASNRVSGTFDAVVFPNSEWGIDYGSNAVTVIHSPVEIISLKPVAGDVLEMVFDCPSPDLAHPLVKTDLVYGGSWVNVGHSIDGSEPFITTNLSYSTAVSGTTNKIYLQATAPSAFFGIGEQ